MSEYSGNVIFKEWLPDQPDLNNPGLTEALNVLPLEGHYAAYQPFTTGSGTTAFAAVIAPTVSGAVNGAFIGDLGTGSNLSFYATQAGTIFTFAGSWITVGSFAAQSYWQFAQYRDRTIAVAGQQVPVQATIGSSSAFTTLASIGTAPAANAIGVIGQFVMLGGFSAGYSSVQWSGIDDESAWPTPNSATAIAMQSGRQDLDSRGGVVTGIYGGDQFGIIAQRGHMTRATYVGGNTVFQFDPIDKTAGSYFPFGGVLAGRLLYYVGLDGFFRTDGVSAERIGKGKVDRYFWNSVTSTFDSPLVIAAYDYVNRLVMWAWPTGVAPSSSGNLLIFSESTGRWTRATDSLHRIFTAPPAHSTVSQPVWAVSTANRMGQLAGAPGTAIITTGETEPNPGGFSRISGVKPLVDQTINAVTVAFGTRNDRTSAVTFSAETTANSRSGFANSRSEARYHRARLTIAGTFNAAQGLEYQSDPSGYT